MPEPGENNHSLNRGSSGFLHVIYLQCCKYSMYDKYLQLRMCKRICQPYNRPRDGVSLAAVTIDHHLFEVNPDIYHLDYHLSTLHTIVQ